MVRDCFFDDTVAFCAVVEFVEWAILGREDGEKDLCVYEGAEEGFGEGVGVGEAGEREGLEEGFTEGDEC